MQSRAAVTLVEVLVALIVFAIAALGSGAVIAHSARQQMQAAWRREALDALRAQAAWLDAQPCAALEPGTTTVAGVDVTWTVAVPGGVWTAELAARHRAGADTLRTVVACR